MSYILFYIDLYKYMIVAYLYYIFSFRLNQIMHQHLFIKMLLLQTLLNEEKPNKS